MTALRRYLDALRDVLHAARYYGPNLSRGLALVHLADRRPFRAHWPVTIVQIVGGRRWSLALTVHPTPGPVLTDPETIDLVLTRRDGDGLVARGAPQ